MNPSPPYELLTATGNAPWEASLVARLSGRPDVRVVRRCVDLADLLATAATVAAQGVVVGPDLHRFDRDALARLLEHRLAVVGMAAGTDSEGRARLAALGVDYVLDAEAAPAELFVAVGAGLTRVSEPAVPTHRRPVRTTTADDGPSDDQPSSASGGSSPGRLVVVWGPTGAPGRTTVAVNLAVESARLGVSTLLADADTYGASVAQVLGLLDEAPGLAAAVRRAASAAPTATDLVRHARQLEPDLRVLTGIPRPERWPELRPAALSAVWTGARDVAALTVIDVGFALERDEDMTYDVAHEMALPRRNAATIGSLDAADLIVVVGSPDPVGVQRLVRGLDELRSIVGTRPLLVVANRVRRSLPGGVRAVGELLHRHASVDEIVQIPDDRAALDACLLEGRALADVAPRSPARLAIRGLAARIIRSTVAPGQRGQLGQPGRTRGRPTTP